MKKQVQILLAGVLVVIPFAATIGVIWWAASRLGEVGLGLAKLLNFSDAITEDFEWVMALVGALLLLGAIYVIGLLTRTYVFRRLVAAAEKLFSRVPGVKTIYESVRDLLKLFGGGSSNAMGKVVLYRPNGGEAAVLALLTNAKPTGLSKAVGDLDLVAVYVPMSFMIGGPLLYVPREHIQEIDMPAEQALRLAATAEITSAPAGGVAVPVPVTVEVKKTAAGSGKS